MARRVKDSGPKIIEDDGQEVLRQQFEEFVDSTITSRTLAERCRDYKDGKQWTEEEQAVLKKRKQPCITDNKIQDKVDSLLGLEKQNRTDPKAYPRTDHENEAAEVATDALRFVADSCDYQRAARKYAADNLVVEGLCAGQVIVEKRAKNYPKVCIEHIRWDRVYYDPHSLRNDFSDKTFCGYFTWMDYDEAVQKWPDAKDKLEVCFSGESAGGPDKSLDDKPRYIVSTRGRRRVQVFKHYRLKGGIWNESVWVKGGMLEEEKPCVYVDENGEPACCIEIEALYRDADGNPYGAVQRYLDLQDEHNKRRSKMLHLLNAKRTILQKGLVDDVNALRSEVHKADGVVEIAGDITQIRVEDNIAESQGQWQLMQQTAESLAATGPNAALQGQSGSISGRAKQLDQAAGSIMVSPVFDSLEAWETRIFRQAWNRIRQFWNSEIWIRVTDDEQKYKFVVVNQPLTQADLFAQQLAHEQMPPEQKAQLLQEAAQNPEMQQPAIVNGKPVIKNRVSEIDVDIVIDRAPDVVNLQQEQFAILAELAKARPEVPFKALIKASQLRSEIKKQISDELDQSGQIPPQIQQAIQQQGEQLQAAQQEVAVAQKEIAKAQQDLAAKQQALADAEMSLREQGADLKVESANLDAKRAEIQADMEKINAALAKLDAKQAEIDAAERGIQLSTEVANERIAASKESARAELTVEAANAERQSAANEKAGSANVLSKISQLIDGQHSKHEQAMAQLEARLMGAMASRGRSVTVKRGPDGKTAALIEE